MQLPLCWEVESPSPGTASSGWMLSSGQEVFRTPHPRDLLDITHADLQARAHLRAGSADRHGRVSNIDLISFAVRQCAAYISTPFSLTNRCRNFNDAHSKTAPERSRKTREINEGSLLRQSSLCVTYVWFNFGLLHLLPFLHFSLVTLVYPL